MKFNLKTLLVVPAFFLATIGSAFADGKYEKQLTQVEVDMQEVIVVVKTSDKDNFERAYEALKDDLRSLKNAIEEEASKVDQEFLVAVEALVYKLEKEESELKSDLASAILEVSEGLSRFSSHMNKWKVALRNGIHRAAEEAEEAGEIALGTVILSVEGLYRAGQEAEKAILIEAEAANARIEAFEKRLTLQLENAKHRGEDAWREVAKELVVEVQELEGDVAEFAQVVQADMEKAELALEDEASKAKAFFDNIGRYLREDARMIGHEARHDLGSVFEWVGKKLQVEGGRIEAEGERINSPASNILL